MSMHEYEHLVDASVGILAHSTRYTRQELRALYWNLYEFEGLWDTHFTQLHSLDLLLAAGYTYRFALSEHPDYRDYPDFFQNLKEFSYLHVHPTQEWDGEQNPVAGYYDPPYLYCDVNSQLWHRFVQQGRLTGDDAVPVERQNPIDLACIVVEEAVVQQNFWLIAAWHALLAPYLVFPTEVKDGNDLLVHPSLVQIRQRYYHTEARNIQLGDYGAYQRPTPEEMKEMGEIEESALAFLSWWFQPPD